MNTNNIIFHMPFDESDGSKVAFDYSQTRADGAVVGAKFIAGKNGNAIEFSGSDTCEVSKSILPNLDSDFTILMWVESKAMSLGSPKQMIWVLNFGGINNYATMSIECNPGSWYSLAITRRASVFNFYVNSLLYKTYSNPGQLQGISLCQDCYGGNYGFGLLDDVKIFNVALSQEELINALSANKQQAYLLDGVNLKEYGVSVAGSDGVLNRPKLKSPASLNWDNYHGESVDLENKYYESRQITLSCFIRADSKMDFIKKVTAFEHLFDKNGTNRLVIDIHPVKPLIYEVYCKDAIDVSKTWNNKLMVGTFKLKLIEPEPVKRVLKHIRTSDANKTCSITLTSQKYLNIYWGDGTVDYDVAGKDRVITHNYAVNGDYFPVVTGCIDEIESFSTNAIIVWDRI